MKFRLSHDKQLNDEIIDLGLNIHQKAISITENYSDVHYAIHELRKSFKEMRGFLRLIRDEIGEDQYKEHNKFYRNLGRKISWLRDIKVYQETLDKIRINYGGKLYKNAFSSIESYLKKLLLEAETGNDVVKIIEIKKLLNEHEIDVLKIKIKDKDKICKSIKRIYSRGKRLYQTSLGEPTIENLHEWRKSAKYLRYQMGMMRFIWPLMMKTLEKGFGQLSDFLGEDHDLAILLLKLEEHTPDKDEYELLIALANNQKSNLQSAAIALGTKLYFEKPKVFSMRIKNYWVAHENSYPPLNPFPQS